MRVLRRFGTAVRSAITAGIALTGRRRRPAPPRPDRAPQADTQHPAGPATPKRQPAASRPRPTAPVPSPQAARAGWLTRWFGRERQPASRPLPPASDTAPFTPQTHPGLSPEACAFFNTPVEQCDPAMLRLVLQALLARIADSLPPELGIDAKTLFSTLGDRLGATPDQAGPDAPPAASRDAVPPAPPRSSPSPAQPQPADAAPLAPQVARDTAPDAISPTGSALHRRGTWLAASPSLPRRQHSGPRRRLPGRSQQLPVRRLCYAACAGPS